MHTCVCLGDSRGAVGAREGARSWALIGGDNTHPSPAMVQAVVAAEVRGEERLRGGMAPGLGVGGHPLSPEPIPAMCAQMLTLQPETRTGTAGARAVKPVGKLLPKKSVNMGVAIKPIRKLLEFSESFESPILKNY